MVELSTDERLHWAIKQSSRYRDNLNKRADANFSDHKKALEYACTLFNECGVIFQDNTCPICTKSFLEVIAEPKGANAIWATLGTYQFGNSWRAPCAYNCIHLRVPRRKRFRGLTAGLTLLSKEVPEGTYSSVSDEQPLWHLHTKGGYNFAFMKGVGREVWEGWLEQCRSDPVFKVILSNHTPI